MPAPYGNPLPSGTLTDGFGYREAIPGVSPAGGHTGQDIAAPEGTPFVTVAPGVVTRIWWDVFVGGAAAGGNMTEIDHGDGWTTRYAHQSARAVVPGQQVSAGQVVGYVGQTGAATGPHLHYEVLQNGTFLDPLPFINHAAAAAASSTTVSTGEEEDMSIVTQESNGKVFWGAGNRITHIVHQDVTKVLNYLGIPGGIVGDTQINKLSDDDTRRWVEAQGFQWADIQNLVPGQALVRGVDRNGVFYASVHAGDITW